MGKVRKSTWKRKLVVLGCKKDFGLGMGIIAEETVVYRDDKGRGFNTPMFAVRLMQDEDDMMKRYVKVVLEEVKPKTRRGKGE